MASSIAISLLYGVHVRYCHCPAYRHPVCTGTRMYANECFARCRGEHTFNGCQTAPPVRAADKRTDKSRSNPALACMVSSEDDDKSPTSGDSTASLRR